MDIEEPSKPKQDEEKPRMPPINLPPLSCGSFHALPPALALPKAALELGEIDSIGNSSAQSDEESQPVLDVLDDEIDSIASPTLDEIVAIASKEDSDELMGDARHLPALPYEPLPSPSKRSGKRNDGEKSPAPELREETGFHLTDSDLSRDSEDADRATDWKQFHSPLFSRRHIYAERFEVEDRKSPFPSGKGTSM
jgi:hypothetical protein